MPKIKIIAHAANGIEKINKSLEKGADLVEIDLWQNRLIKKEIIAAHFGPFGWFGIGSAFSKILNSGNLILPNRMVLDLKWGGLDLARNLTKLFNSNSYKKVFVSSSNWESLIWLSKFDKFAPLFTIANFWDLGRFFAHKPYDKVKKQSGVSIRHTLLSPKLSPKIIAKLKKRNLQIFAWTVNSEKRAKELEDLGVTGILTDNLKLFSY